MTPRTKIRPKAAAILLGYSYSYVCKLAREGYLTRYYPGTIRSYLLDRAEVLAFPNQRVI